MARLERTFAAQHALSRARIDAFYLRNFVVTPAHLLLGLEAVDGSAARYIRAHYPGLRRDLEAKLREPLPKKRVWRSDARFDAALREAAREAERVGSKAVGTGHLFAGVLSVCSAKSLGLRSAPLHPALFDVEEELAEAKLLSSDKWFREYKTSESQWSFSKFSTGEASITSSKLKKSWPRWSQGQRSQFALAYNAKFVLNADDKRIIRFVARKASGRVRINASGFLTRLPPHEGYPLIVKWIQEPEPDRKANLYQALGSKKFVPYGALKFLEEELRTRLQRRDRWAKIGVNDPDDDLLDTVACVQSLYDLRKTQRNRALLLEFTRLPNKYAASWAKSTLGKKL